MKKKNSNPSLSGQPKENKPLISVPTEDKQNMPSGKDEISRRVYHAKQLQKLQELYKLFKKWR